MAPRLLPALLLLAACNTDSIVNKVDRKLTVSPGLVDFDTVPLGSSSTATIKLTHTAGGDIDVVSFEIRDVEGSEFSTDATPMTIPTEGEEEITVSYAPAELGYHLSQLVIYTNEETDSEHVVDLRGHAGTSDIVVTPALLDFGPVDPGDTATGYVTLDNVGDVDVSLDAAGFDPLFASPFSLPATIAAGGSLDFPITVTPIDDSATFGNALLAFTGAEDVDIDLRVNACVDGDPNIYDADGDGWTSCGGDCDDTDADSHPGGIELCDAVDQDCDTVLDNDTECYDDDGDGFTEEDGDCVDSNDQISPRSNEDMANGIDDDCDGIVDLGTSDSDGDGFSEAAGDCEPFEATIYPGATEVADGSDNDCDGLTDEGTNVYDDDGDGTSELGGDCDDTDASINPGASESANGVDDNCDGTLDEGTTWADDDSDGWSERGGDCDDADLTINPGAREVTGDGIDNDCDGSAE